MVNIWFSKSFFYNKNHPNLSISVFLLKNIKLGKELSLLTCFEYFIFEALYLLKSGLIFGVLQSI